MSAEIASLKAKLAQLTQENEVLLKLVGGTTPTTTQPVPTVIMEGVKLKASTADYLTLAGAICLMLLLWIIPLSKPIRGCIESKIHRIMPVITVINFIILGATLDQLQFVEFNDLFFKTVKITELVIETTQKFLLAVAGLFVLWFLWKFKDRILETLGVDNPTMVIGEFRDWATCWSMKRFYPIEIFILKVEGLPGLHLHQFNDVFVEVSCGYNNTMRTRVHERAGHTCVFKESMQLNFDHLDTESNFHVDVKNQDVMGATDIASIVLGAGQVHRMMEPDHLDAESRTVGWGATTSTQGGGGKVWGSKFHCLDMIPAGKVWIRFQPVSDEDHLRTSYGKVGSTC